MTLVETKDIDKQTHRNKIWIIKWIVGAICGILLIIFIYYMSYNSIINEAEKLYNDGNFISAYNKIENLSIMKKDKELFDAIKLKSDEQKEINRIEREKANAEKRVKEEEQKKLRDELESKRKNPIIFNDKTNSESYNYMTISGSAYNQSDLTLTYVKIQVNFMDNDGNVLDSNWTYVVGSDPLRPNESKKWEVSVKSDDRFKKYSVKLLDFNY